MRYTEFWSRMEDELGAAYHTVWAREFVMSELGGRTVLEALDEGIPPKRVWAAVCNAREIPESAR